jgi:hypothetical protein
VEFKSTHTYRITGAQPFQYFSLSVQHELNRNGSPFSPPAYSSDDIIVPCNGNGVWSATAAFERSRVLTQGNYEARARSEFHNKNNPQQGDDTGVVAQSFCVRFACGNC